MSQVDEESVLWVAEKNTSLYNLTGIKLKGNKFSVCFDDLFPEIVHWALCDHGFS